MRARRTAHLAEVQALNQELQSYDEEVQSYDARRRVLTVRLDLRTRERGYAERVANSWRELVTKRRKADADRAAEEAIQALFDASGAPRQIRDEVEALAEENVRFADDRTGEEGVLRRIERNRSRRFLRFKSALPD